MRSGAVATLACTSVVTPKKKRAENSCFITICQVGSARDSKQLLASPSVPILVQHGIFYAPFQAQTLGSGEAQAWVVFDMCTNNPHMTGWMSTVPYHPVHCIATLSSSLIRALASEDA